MNKIIISLSVVVVVIVLIGYVIAGPHLAINDIKEAIEQGDSDQLSDNIDFPVLRVNFKEQFNANMMKEAAADLKDNPFGLLAAGLMTSMADTMVDAFITPSGLAAIMKGNRPGIGQEDPISDTESREVFKDAQYTYDGLSSFSAWVPDDSGQETRFVLTREFLSWKLTNIIFPPTPP